MDTKLLGTILTVFFLSTASIGAEASNEFVEETTQWRVQCGSTSSLIEFNGRLHVLVNDNKVMFQDMNYRGVVVDGDYVGTKYVRTGATNNRFSVGNLDEGITVTDVFDFTGQGQAPNYRFRLKWIVRRVNGEIKVSIFEASSTCK